MIKLLIFLIRYFKILWKIVLKRTSCHNNLQNCFHTFYTDKNWFIWWKFKNNFEIKLLIVNHYIECPDNWINLNNKFRGHFTWYLTSLTWIYSIIIQPQTILNFHYRQVWSVEVGTRLFAIFYDYVLLCTMYHWMLFTLHLNFM